MCQRGREPGEDRFGPLVHAQRVGLGRKHVAQPIDDQARQAVGLGVDQAIGVGRVGQAEQVVAKLDGLVELLLPGGVVRQFFAVENHADGDFAPRIVEAVAEHAVVGPIDGHEVARPGLFDAIEPLAIEKRMPGGRADEHGGDRRGRIGGQRALAEDVAAGRVARLAGFAGVF